MLLRMRPQPNLEPSSTFDARAYSAYAWVFFTQGLSVRLFHTEYRTPLRSFTHAYPFFDAYACVCVQTHPVRIHLKSFVFCCVIFLALPSTYLTLVHFYLT